MPTWMNAANAVLVTSDNEGFGLVAVEALACDVPVLSTPVGIAPFLLARPRGMSRRSVRLRPVGRGRCGRTSTRPTLGSPGRQRAGWFSAS